MSLSRKIEEKRRAKKRAIRNEKIKVATISVAAGAITGALGGVLLAPKAGKETIQDVKDASKQVSEKVNVKMGETKLKINSKLNDTKEGIVESKQKIREYLNEKKKAKQVDEQSQEEILLITEDVNEENQEIEA